MEADRPLATARVMTFAILAVVFIAALLALLALHEADLEANYTLPFTNHTCHRRDERKRGLGR